MQGFAPALADRVSGSAQGQAETLPYRRPFGGEPPETGEGFDWRSLAASAAGAAGLAAILGSARFGGRFDQNAKLYREFIRNVSREGAPAVPASTGADWVKRLLGGSWWHGTPATEDVLKKGFAPEYEKMGLRFGEPHGVSVSADPRRASAFGSTGENVLRVWPKVDPKSVLPVWADEAHEPIIKAYMQALEHQPNLNDPRTVRDFLSELNSGGWGMKYAANEMPSRYPHIARQFNQRLSEELEKQGIQGLLYNPHRYNEYEMRILDPRKAVPIEERRFRPSDSLYQYRTKSPMGRFADLKSKRVIAPYDASIPYSMNKSLSEHYAQIPESRVLGIPSFAEAHAAKQVPKNVGQDWAQKMMGPDSYGTGNAPAPTFQGASPNMTIQAKIDLAAAHVNKNMTPNSGEWWYEVGKLLNEEGEMEAAHAAYAVASQKGAKPW